MAVIHLTTRLRFNDKTTLNLLVYITSFKVKLFVFLDLPVTRRLLTVASTPSDTNGSLDCTAKPVPGRPFCFDRLVFDSLKETVFLVNRG